MKDEKSFTFLSEVVNRNKKINDQNTFQFRFFNLGGTDLLINNTIPLPLTAPMFGQYTENIQTNEKTVTQYSITFANEADPLNKLLIISKIPATA